VTGVALPQTHSPTAGGNFTIDGREIACRAALVVLLAVMAHQFAWGWLRLVTSGAVLQLSGMLGIAATRVSSTVIAVRDARFDFVTACTFVDVYLASIPLIWDIRGSLSRNAIRLAVAGGTLLAFNIFRLEIAVLLYCHDVGWAVADGVVGGCAYFLVWLGIWRTRCWGLDMRTSG